jgi:hypothetical protein
MPNKLDMNVHWVNTLAKLEFFVMIRNSTWPILCSDWLIFQKSTSQKPLGRFDYDIVDMFITWSCTSFKFSVPIKKQYDISNDHMQFMYSLCSIM